LITGTLYSVLIMEAKSDTISTPELFESWVSIYTNGLYSWALFKTSNKETAEDLVQETFLTAHQQLSRFRGESSPKTWLFAILNNKIKAHFRKKYRQTYIGQDHYIEKKDLGIFKQLFNDDDRWKEPEKPMPWTTDEAHLLDNREFNKVLTSCLNKLPDHWRSAVNLKYIEQKKGEIICQELNIAPTNFWQILHRAKLQLRKCLEINWFKA
jgi:RNA polymerase sigma-70 factor (TIGR02943 family)